MTASGAADGLDVVLVGMMGTGKSTVGSILAARTGRPLLDSDELVEIRTGRTVRQLWAEHGEPGYRDLETAALRDAIGATPGGAVIAAAGGVVLREENRRLLRDSGALIVWLRAGPEVLYQRVKPSIDGGHRPLLDDDPLGTLSRLDADRAPLYAEVASETIDVDRLSPGLVADVIAGVLSEREARASARASASPRASARASASPRAPAPSPPAGPHDIGGVE